MRVQHLFPGSLSSDDLNGSVPICAPDGDRHVLRRSKDGRSAASACSSELATAEEKTYENGTTSRAPSEVAKQSGLDLEKQTRPPVEAELFLDIPFYRTH